MFLVPVNCPLVTGFLEFQEVIVTPWLTKGRVSLHNAVSSISNSQIRDHQSPSGNSSLFILARWNETLTLSSLSLLLKY